MEMVAKGCEGGSWVAVGVIGENLFPAPRLP